MAGTFTIRSTTNRSFISVNRIFIKKNGHLLSSMGALSLTSLFGSTVLTSMAITWQDTLLNLSISEWGLLFALSALTMALALTPSTLIALVSGYFLGWSALPFITITYPLAALLGFMASKILDRGKIMHSLSSSSADSRLPLLIKELNRQAWLLVILVRISPILPFSLMNLLLPAIGVRLSTFLLAGFIGMLPRTLFSLWVGMQGRDLVTLLTTPGQDSLPLVLVLVSVLSVGGLVYLLQKASSALAVQKYASNNSENTNYG